MLNKFIVIFMLLAYKPKLLKILNICMIIDEWHVFYIVSLCKRIKDKGLNNPLGTAKKNIKSINNNYVDFLAQIENGRYYVASIDVWGW